MFVEEAADLDAASCIQNARLCAVGRRSSYASTPCVQACALLLPILRMHPSPHHPLGSGQIPPPDSAGCLGISAWQLLVACLPSAVVLHAVGRCFACLFGVWAFL